MKYVTGLALMGLAAPMLVHADASDFIGKSSTTLGVTYYGRDRSAPNKAGGEINVNALSFGADFKSGYVNDLIGLDLGAFATANLTSKGKGQSEVLLFEPNGQGQFEDKSNAAISVAALKLKTGDKDNGLRLKAGYTPISVGSLGTSGGLHTHAYRGLEAKYQFGAFEVGYGWADQFRPEWDNKFRDITNKWHQNRYGNTDGKKIDYVHSIGLRYNTADGFVDVGFGEGKDFRRNAQIAASNTWKLATGDSLNVTGYYIQGKNYGDIGGSNAPTQWHASVGATYTTGGLSLFGGYGQTRTKDFDEMNFRVASWANADNRNFIQTWGQLDDFVWDGTKVFKFGATYDFSKIGVPGLTAGASFNTASGMRNANASDTRAEEFDVNLGYTVQSGTFKDVSIGVYPAQLRTHDFHGKNDRDDVKVIVSYSKTW